MERKKKMSDVYKKQIGGDHYQSMKIQPSEFINKNNLPFAEGNAIKYLCRHKQKGQKKDFLEEAEKEKKELEESYREAKRQTEERKSTEWIKGYNKWKKDK